MFTLTVLKNFRCWKCFRLVCWKPCWKVFMQGKFKRYVRYFQSKFKQYMRFDQWHTKFQQRCFQDVESHVYVPSINWQQCDEFIFVSSGRVDTVKKHKTWFKTLIELAVQDMKEKHEVLCMRSIISEPFIFFNFTCPSKPRQMMSSFWCPWMTIFLLRW